MRTTTESLLLHHLMPKVRRMVLARLLLSDREWYPRELARMLGLSHSAVTVELYKLRMVGIAKGRRSGNQALYSADKDCPVYAELRGLFAKTAGLAELVRTALEPLAGRLRAAYIFGSMASGTTSRRSDVDLMLVGAVSLYDAENVLGATAAQLQREINVTTYPVEEYVKQLSVQDSFVSQVHNGKVIQVMGDMHELEQT